MATGKLLPGFGLIIETKNSGGLLPGLGLLIETEVVAPPSGTNYGHMFHVFQDKIRENKYGSS